MPALSHQLGFFCTNLKTLFYFLMPKKGEIKVRLKASFACLGASTLVRIITVLELQSLLPPQLLSL